MVDGVMVVGDGEVSTSSADINADVGHELRVSDGDVSTSSTDINADAGPGVSDISSFDGDGSNELSSDFVDGVNLSRNLDTSVDAGTKTVKFTWPQLGWDVISLKGLVPTGELSYDSPIVPPPLGACCRADVKSDDLLFGRRRLHRSVNSTSRIITSDEYNRLILDAEV